jgi:hypothetical protein
VAIAAAVLGIPPNASEQDDLKQRGRAPVDALLGKAALFVLFGITRDIA